LGDLKHSFGVVENHQWELSEILGALRPESLHEIKIGQPLLISAWSARSPEQSYQHKFKDIPIFSEKFSCNRGGQGGGRGEGEGRGRGTGRGIPGWFCGSLSWVTWNMFSEQYHDYFPSLFLHQGSLGSEIIAKKFSWLKFALQRARNDLSIYSIGSKLV
jgi:hypothetical protein